MPSSPQRGTFTPVYAGTGGGGGTTSPGMTIPIGAMSLSSRYETRSRSGVSSLADEEEEEEEEGEEGEEGMVMKNDLNRKTKEESGVVNAVDGEEEEEEEEEKGLKMDVDVG